MLELGSSSEIVVEEVEQAFGGMRVEGFETSER